MDQFIFFEDIHEFAVQVCRTWGVPVPDFGTIKIVHCVPTFDGAEVESPH